VVAPISTRVFRLPLMTVTIAASEHAIHSIDLVEHPALPAGCLISEPRHPANTAEPRNLLDIIEQRVRCGVDLSDLPTAQVGTEFQHSVWHYIRGIPRGTVATYAEVAAAIGRPRAVRAVANACACNTVALAIPCHRIVRSDGSLGGYRWGIRLKQRLLSLEGSSHAEVAYE
jgi:AraC family transcriptional regulator of adaptative response/methylated-DNA-[protein]-cysteine methyltransferase